ncbi:MAG: hypothetical protein K2Y21_08300 [Phycisphaerales bacterium]|nr:hypothetical protein [Phycisphaerales bacterium]
MERRVEPKRGSTPARALVCHAPGSPPPTTLLQALERRAFVVETVPGTHRVLARAVVIRHDPDSSDQRLVVVLVEPSRLSRPSECLDALRTMPGGVACWVFDAATSELRAASAVDVESWSDKNRARTPQGRPSSFQQNTAPSAAYESAARSAPALRLTGDWADAAQASSGVSGQTPGGSALQDPADHAQAPPSLLTDEELDMLLGDDNGAGPTAGPERGTDLGTGSR